MFLKYALDLPPRPYVVMSDNKGVVEGWPIRAKKAIKCSLWEEIHEVASRLENIGTTIIVNAQCTTTSFRESI